MTTLYEEKVKCCVCGAKTKFTDIGSTNTLGLPDLDTRPAEMQRSTMFAWVQRCPKCGYCASDVSSLKEGSKIIVTRNDYKRQLEDPTYPALANSFLCKAMIEHESNDYVAATFSLIHAAWACDDSDQDRQAITCREKAADMIVIAEEHGQQVSQQDGARTGILSDLLRRAGRFEQARQVIEKGRVNISDENIARILDFQIALINQNDRSCHSIDEALEEKNKNREDSVIAEPPIEKNVFFKEKVRLAQTEFTKMRQSSKLIADVNFILRNHEKQYKKRSNQWHENVLMKPDYKYDEIEYICNTQTNSPLSMTLKNILYHLLESECGTRYKAKNVINQLYSKEPELFWPMMNYVPSIRVQHCYPESLVCCFDEDDLNIIFRELIDHIEKCREQCKTVFFVTSQWNPEIYSRYSDKIDALGKNNINFTFISFTILGATEIVINATGYIKRNIWRLRRLFERFLYFFSK